MQEDTDSQDHDLSVVGEYRIGGFKFFRSFCSCGKYRSGLRPTESAAEKDGIQHVKSKTTTRREELQCTDC